MSLIKILWQVFDRELLKQVPLLLLLLPQASDAAILFVLEALLSLGDLVTLGQKQTGNVPHEILIIVVISCGATALPGWPHINRLVFVIRVEVCIYLQESLQYGVLNSLIN